MNEIDYVVEIAKIVELIQESNENAKIVLIAPWTTLKNDRISKLSHEEKIAMIDNFSDALNKFANENEFIYINPNENLREFYSANGSFLFSKDGIHPNSNLGIQLYSTAILESSN